MVFISAIVKTLGHELVAGHAFHSGEHALIMNAARAQLRSNHVLPLRSKSIAMDLRIHACEQNSAEKFFFALFAYYLAFFAVKRKSGGIAALSPLPLTNSNIETHYTILITHPYDRNIPRHVVFNLNNLLRSLRDVRRVGQPEDVLHLLLDPTRTPGCRRRCLRPQPLRRDRDADAAKRPLNPVIE